MYCKIIKKYERNTKTWYNELKLSMKAQPSYNERPNTVTYYITDLQTLLNKYIYGGDKHVYIYKRLSYWCS
jgi:hypothetical protein